jgi:hypothetical protein
MTRPPRSTAVLVPLLVALLLPAGCGRESPSEARQTDDAAVTNQRPDGSGGEEPGVAGSESATKSDDRPVPLEAGPPELTFETDTYDFGTFSETESRSGRIRFTSTGGETLVIDEIKTTCGCTLASMDKMRYEPGETGELKLTFEPTAPGEQKKYITVFSNATAQPQRLTVTANVLPFITFEPRMLKLGVLRYGDQHRAEVMISCVDPDATLESIRTTNQHVSARVVADSDLDDASSGTTVEVTIAPTATWGSLFSWLIVTYEGRPAPGAEPIRHTSRIRIQGQLFGELIADPDTVRFGIAPNESFERSIELTCPSGEPFEILDATAESEGLVSPQVRIEPISPHEYRLVFTAVAGPTPRTCQGAVLVRTNVFGEEELRIPVVGRVRAPR